MASDSDRQYLLRTVLGEAARQPDAGKAAVAHVVLNRLKSGRYGGDVRSVVMAPNQFEPWGSPEGRARMMGYREDDPAYQSAARIVDGVLSGQIPDPTGGADHFLNEEIVRQRRGGSLPGWAEKMANTAHRIGDHTFYGGSGADTMAGGGGFNPDKLEAVRARIQGGNVAFNPDKLEAARKRAQPQNSDIPAGMVPIRDEAGNVIRYHDTKAEAEIVARERPAAAYVGGLAGQALKGVPFIGEYADEALGAADEALGGQEGLRQEQIRARNERFERDNPISATGANIVGGVAATAPLAVGPLAAAAARMAPASLAGRVAAGAGVGVAGGAAEGAVSGYGSGRNNAERRANAGQRALIGGAVGGVVGAAAPAIGEGVRNLVTNARARPDRATAAALGMSPQAAEVVGRTLSSDGAAQARRNISDAGADAMIADAGPATSGLLDYSIQKAGPGGRIARDAIDERANRAGVQISETLDQFLGPSTGIKRAGRDIASRTAAVRAQAYNAAYNTPINYASAEGRAIEEVLSRIPPKEMRAAIEEANADMLADGVKNQQIMAEILDDGSVAFREMPNVRQLDYIKRGLDKSAERDAFDRITEKGRRPARLAKELRDALSNAAVNDSGVKTYERALRLGADKISEDRALMTGRRILSPQFTREDVADALERASPAELRAARLGLRRQIDEVMSNVKRAVGDANMDAREGVKAMKELSSGAVREKLAVVLGPKASTEMLARIDRAAKAFELKARTADNSKTFARQSTDDMVRQMTEPGAVGQLMQARPAQAIQSVIQSMTRMTPQERRLVEERIAGEIATALTQMRGPQARNGVDRVLKMLARQPETEALANAVARYVAGSSAAIGYNALTAQ